MQVSPLINRSSDCLAATVKFIGCLALTHLVPIYVFQRLTDAVVITTLDECPVVFLKSERGWTASC